MSDPRIPREDVDRLAAELKAIRADIKRLSVPSGTQQATLLNYLLSLKTFVSYNPGTLVSGVPADNTVRYFDTDDNGVITQHVPTGRCVISVTSGYARVISTGGWVEATITYEVRNAAGTVVVDAGDRRGILFTNLNNLTTSLRAAEYPISLDPDFGPYTFRQKLGVRVETTGAAGPAGANFSANSIRVDIVGADA